MKIILICASVVCICSIGCGSADPVEQFGTFARRIESKLQADGIPPHGDMGDREPGKLVGFNFDLKETDSKLRPLRAFIGIETQWPGEDHERHFMFRYVYAVDTKTWQSGANETGHTPSPAFKELMRF